MAKILPVIMCGGAGTRVWPESRDSLPKQFIPLVSERSTFQTLVEMLKDPVFDKPIVLTNIDYRFLVQDQLRAIAADAASRCLLSPATSGALHRRRAASRLLRSEVVERKQSPWPRSRANWASRSSRSAVR